MDDFVPNDFAMPTFIGVAIGGTLGLVVIFYFLLVLQKFSHTGALKILWATETLGAITAFYITAILKKAPSDSLKKFMETRRGIFVGVIIFLSAPAVVFSLGALLRSAG